MQRARKLQLATIAAISLFAVTAEAARVVVLEVRGEDDSEFETMLVDAIKGEHDVVESRAFDRAARREGVGDDLDPRSIAKVVRSLEAAAVLDPLLAKRNGEWELTIRVRGKDGLVKKKMKVSLDAPRLGNKGKKKVAKELLGVLDEVLTKDTKKSKAKVRARVEAEDDEDEEERPAKSRSRSRDDARDDEDDADADEDVGDGEETPLPSKPERKRVARGDDDEDAGIDEELDDDDLRPRRGRKASRELRRYGLMVEAGAAAVQRKLTFTSREFDRAPAGYPGSPAPAAHVAGEVYPLAIINPKSVAGGIGFYAEYDRTTSLTTRTSQAAEVAMPTQQIRWSFGAKLRYAFGSAPNLPSVILGMGYGRRTFIIDRSGLPDGAALDLPDVDYRIYEPSLTLRVPIGTARVALSLGARGLFFKSAGAIQLPTQYGAAKLTGVDGEVGIDAAVTSRVLLRLHGTYTTIGYDFVGNGYETNSRDMDPDTQDVGGANDTWLSAGASLGVVY